MKCVDLFSGCGGMTLGFQNAEYDVVASFDNWEPAIEVYKTNFEHPIIHQDLSDVENSVKKIKKFKPQIIIGGPPCQDFSSAGKRDVTLGRADLTYSFEEIVNSISPKWFVMENVELITKSHILHEIISKFEIGGYGLTVVILDASYCGAPQKRHRFFLIGKKKEKHNFLLGNLYDALSKKPMTIKDYLKKEIDIDYYYRHPRNYNRRGIFSVNEPSPTIRGVNRPIPGGYTPNSCDPSGVKLSDIRPLTTEERARIQTFPKSFKFLGTKTSKEQMIGNAVPVNLAKFVAKVIANYESTGVVALPGQGDMFDNELIIPKTTLNRMFKK
jgi:DNA (cytosine-5)-methyltransferase 1